MRSSHALALVVGLTGLVTACSGDGNGPSNIPPAAAFTPSCAHLVCVFADGSSDPDGQVTAYTWDFGDGAAAVTTKDAQHTYAAANTYTVSLTVTDNDGAAAGVTKSVQVSTPANTPPTANFTASCTALACSFTDLSTDADGTVVGIHWDFGDGAEATTQNATHAYATAGTYIVALVVTDDRGTTGTLSQPVTVAGPQTGGPTADFTGLCVVGGHIGRIVFVDCTFTDQSTAAAGATVTAWTWDFGDGRTATEQNPAVHHYTMVSTGVRPLSVAVRLRVTDSNGLTNELTKSVPVSVAATTPTIGLSPTSFRFCFHPGSTRNCVTPTLQLSITNIGGGTLTWNVKSNQSWLQVSPTSGTTPSPDVAVSVNPAGLPPVRGTYFGSITVSAEGASNSPQTVSVRLDY
jgi:YD repeat-containing protein